VTGLDSGASYYKFSADEVINAPAARTVTDVLCRTKSSTGTDLESATVTSVIFSANTLSSGVSLSTSPDTNGATDAMLTVTVATEEAIVIEGTLVIQCPKIN